MTDPAAATGRYVQSLSASVAAAADAGRRGRVSLGPVPALTTPVSPPLPSGRGLFGAGLERLLHRPVHVAVVRLVGVELRGELEDHGLDRVLLHLERGVDERRQQLLGHVGAQDLLAGVGEPGVPREQVDRVGLVDDRVDRAALPLHPLVVGGPVASAREPEGLEPVEVLVGPRLEVAGRRDVPVGVAVDRHRLVDVHGDPADRVDDLPEAVEVDQQVVVDRDAECTRDRQLHRVGTLVVGAPDHAGVGGRDVAVDRVEHLLAVIAALLEPVGVERVQRGAGGERHVAQVAREAEHHRAAGVGVDADQDHGVGADAGPPDAAVAPEEQQVDPVLGAPGVLSS